MEGLFIWEDLGLPTTELERVPRGASGNPKKVNAYQFSQSSCIIMQDKKHCLNRSITIVWLLDAFPCSGCNVVNSFKSSSIHLESEFEFVFDYYYHFRL